MNEFDTWNGLKQKIHKKKKIPYFREGQIWWMHLGLNIGNEIHGKGKYFLRPCLIITKLAQRSVFVIPITTQKKSGNYFMKISEKQILCLHQTKIISTKRFFKKTNTKIASSKLLEIKEKLNHTLKICPPK